MPFNIGPGELIIVLVIALIVVGPGKLPDVGAALGKSLREFRQAASDAKDVTSIEPVRPTPAPAAPVAPAPVASAPVAAAAQPAVTAAVTAPPSAESGTDEPRA